MRLDIVAREEWVRSALRDEAARSPSLGLPELCRALETRLDELMLEAAADELAFAAPAEAGFRNLDGTRFVSDGKRYEVRCGASPDEPEVLVISLSELGVGAQAARRRAPHVRLDTPGKYARLQVVADSTQPAWHDLLASTAKTVVEAGGRWIEHYVLQEIESTVASTGDGLYAVIRQALPESVASQVWLFSMYRGRGLYVSDRITRGEGLLRARERLVRTAGSPLEHIAELTTRVLDLDQLFAAQVLASNTTLEVDISNARYSSAFELAEEAVFHTAGLTVQPLVRDGNTRLIATYPSHLRSAVEPILTVEREQFQRVLDQTSRWLQRTMQRLRSLGYSPGLPGVLGEFMGGMFKPYFQP